MQQRNILNPANTGTTSGHIISRDGFPSGESKIVISPDIVTVPNILPPGCELTQGEYKDGKKEVLGIKDGELKVVCTLQFEPDAPIEGFKFNNGLMQFGSGVNIVGGVQPHGGPQPNNNLTPDLP